MDNNNSTPEPTPTPTTEPSSQPSPTQNWYDSLGDEFKTNASITKFKDVTELAKGYVNLEKYVGVDKMERPSKNWDEQKWRKFHTELGCPESPEKYENPKMPEGVEIDKEGLEFLKKSAFKNGWNQSQFQGAVDAWNEHISSIVKRHAESQKASQEEALRTIQKEWGKDFDVKSAQAQKAIKQFGGDEAVEKFNRMGLSNDPDVLRIFQRIGESISEDSATGSTNAKSYNLGMSKQEAQMEISKCQRDKDFISIVQNPSHPSHKEFKERWNNLFKMAYKD